jgi:hypothetical protein
MSSNEPAIGNSKMFGEFPLSIRIAQRSIVVAILIPIILRAFLRPRGKAQMPWMQFAVGASSGACVLVGFIATYYAVIRYPYMGLVDAADGDLFSKHIESQKKWVRVAAILICLLIAASGILLPMGDGQVAGWEWLVIFYSSVVFSFVIFLMFYYDRVDHPTIATFLRCSMGLGIFLFPLFVPAIVIGSLRVNTLLDEAIMKMEAEKKRTGLSE